MVNPIIWFKGYTPNWYFYLHLQTEMISGRFLYRLYSHDGRNRVPVLSADIDFVNERLINVIAPRIDILGVLIVDKAEIAMMLLAGDLEPTD